MTEATQFSSGHRPAEGGEDLSAEIVRVVERDPGHMVRCTRVSDDGYRCNWWAPLATGGYDNPGMGGLLVTTHRVRRSRFLVATKLLGHLLIREAAEPPFDRYTTSPAPYDRPNDETGNPDEE